jgi:predicted metalloprotease with PDZ domain
VDIWINASTQKRNKPFEKTKQKFKKQQMKTTSSYDANQLLSSTLSYALQRGIQTFKILKNMKNKILYLFFLLGFQNFAFSQNVYKVEFGSAQSVKVSHKLDKTLSGTILYEFPGTIPGTYATQDYGRFITDLNVFDSSGEKLKVKKISNNTFQIEAPSGLDKIEYNAQSILHQKVKKDRIFEPASTFIEFNKFAVLNGGGIFGYVEGHENEACRLEFIKPKEWYGATSLNEISNSDTQQVFSARNYHAVIDAPIIFARPDTTSFYVKNTKVTLACYDVQGKKLSAEFAKDIEADLNAVGDFLPSLPVDRYTFLIFVDDLRDVGDMMNSGEMGLFKIMKLQSRFKNKALGALEHNTSSLYYLGDFGDSPPDERLKLINQLNESAIHEFMHIITPLSLHSELIQNFNYKNPVMSQHLWLYEGVTEYFSHLIRLQGGRITEEEFLKEMNSKIMKGGTFPETMTFTEMSKNVLQKEYKPQFIQVYMRGAVLAWLLDINIRKVTNNQKTLIDVIWSLTEKYGSLNPFDEATFIEEFAKEIDPEILTFFAKYIDGNEKWQIHESAHYIGLSYEKDTINTPVHPFRNIPGTNEVKIAGIIVGGKSKVKKVGSPSLIALQKGDLFDASEVQELISGNKMGETINIPIVRNGQKMELPYKLEIPDKNARPYLRMTDKNLWKNFVSN